MNNLILLILLISGLQIFAHQSNAANCGNTTPAYCVGEPIYYATYPGKIVGFAANGTYSVEYLYTDGATHTQNNLGLDSLYKATSRKCGTTQPKFCVDNTVYHQTYAGKVVGTSSTGKYAVKYKYTDGKYHVVQNVDPLDLNNGTQNKCGATTPKFCVGEEVLYGNYRGKIVGFSARGTYAVDYTYTDRNNYVGLFPVSALSKTQKSGVNLNCEDVSGELGDTPSDVANAYTSLAQISTSERADFLTEVSKALGAPGQQDAMTTLFARFVFAKVVNLSTAKAVKSSFQSTVDQDQKELEKIGWKSLDQIEAQVGTLNFAARILSAAVKVRMNMPQMNESISSFRSRLAMASADTRLSTKVSALHGIAQDMQPLLMELIQDPRNSALGMVAQDAAGWVLKN